MDEMFPPHPAPPGRPESEQPTQQIPLADPGTRQLPFASAGGPGRAPVWRRRPWQIGAGIGVLAVLGLVVGIVAGASGPSTPGPSPAADSRPGFSAPPLSPSIMPGKGAGKGKGHHKGAGAGAAGPSGAAAPFALGPGESVLLGTVSSVTGGQLTVAADGRGPVTVTTDGSTKFAGGAKSATDLKPGDRVTVVVRGGTAVTVRVPGVRLTGTITGLNGTTAKLVEPDGQTVAIDLAGVANPPANGNVVVVTGTVPPGGTTVQVSKVAVVAAAG